MEQERKEWEMKQMEEKRKQEEQLAREKLEKEKADLAKAVEDEKERLRVEKEKWGAKAEERARRISAKS